MPHQEENPAARKGADEHSGRLENALAQIHLRLAALERDKADRAEVVHLAQQLKSLSQP